MSDDKSTPAAQPPATEPKGQNCFADLPQKFGCTSDNLAKGQGLLANAKSIATDKEGMKEKMKANKEKMKAEGLEFEDRDTEGLHDDLKVNFADVIAEPDGVHSFATIWGTSYKTYSVCKFWAYRVLTAILGIPFALFWGFYFAMLAFMNVWCIVPFVKCFTIQMKFVSEIWSKLINTFLDPFFTSIGKVFANIQMTITMLQDKKE